MCGDRFGEGQKIEARGSVGGCHSCTAKSGRWPGLEGCHSGLADRLGMGGGRSRLVWPEHRM